MNAADFDARKQALARTLRELANALELAESRMDVGLVLTIAKEALQIDELQSINLAEISAGLQRTSQRLSNLAGRR